MARRRTTARKSVRNVRQAPYQLYMRTGESVSAYIHRLRICLENYHLNVHRGYSDFNTPPKQADVLIYTLSDIGPFSELKKEYNDILKNGKPNWARYADKKDNWFLTLEYLEKRMVDMEAKWYYNLGFDRNEEGVGSSGAVNIPGLGMEDDETEDPEEDPDVY